MCAPVPARWQSGYAEDCKSSYVGSIPARASKSSTTQKPVEREPVERARSMPAASSQSAASRGGAAVMGRSRELGTIEAGRLADMVIPDADPLADIRNTSRIHLVVNGGRTHDPAEIECTVLARTR